MGFWSDQKQAAIGDLMESAGQLAATLQTGRELAKADAEYRAGYARALEAAKVSGDMPETYQSRIPEDVLLSQVGVKVIALKQLEKFSPTHPLVVSPEARAEIAKQTRINYNKANRPDGVDLNTFAPSDDQTKRILHSQKG